MDRGWRRLYVHSRICKCDVPCYGVVHRTGDKNSFLKGRQISLFFYPMQLSRIKRADVSRIDYLAVFNHPFYIRKTYKTSFQYELAIFWMITLNWFDITR